MEYRQLPDGTKISTISVGVGNYAYARVSPEEIEKIFQVASCLTGAVSAREMERTLQFYDAPAERRDYSFIGALQSKEMAGSCTYCGHCQPCPAGIDISAVNRYYDLAKVGDQLAVEHYKALSKNAYHCTGCGVCVKRCPFHVDAKSKMKEISKFFSLVK